MEQPNPYPAPDQHGSWQEPPQTQPYPPRKKSGCLRFTCGCLVVVLVGTIIFAFMGWFYLNRWEPGRTAWEHLPPDTLFAIEVHDMKELLERGLSDRGVLSLLSGVERRFASWAKELTMDSAYRDIRYFGELREFYEQAGFAYRVLLPNIIGVASSDPEAEEYFVYFRPPAWLRLALSEEDYQQVEEISDNGESIYLCIVDGWVILSGTESVVEHARANWHAGGSPFGKKAKIIDPHITVAVRMPAEGNAVNGGDMSQMSGPLFPGGETPGGQGAFADGAGEIWRGLLLATPETWEIVGDYWADADVVPTTAPELVMKSEDTILPAPPLGEQDPSQMRLAVKMAETEWRELLGHFPDSSGAGSSWRDRAMTWLRWDWLERMQGNILFTADRPVVGATDEVVPAPVVGAGWLFATGDGQAGAGYNKGLAELVEAALEPGGPMGSFANAFSLEMRTDGHGGVVDAPAVVAYGAKPAWRVYPGAERDMGWLASDPSGLPEEKNGLYALRETFFTQEEPDAVAFTWDVSQEFLRSGMEFLRDWLAFPVTVSEEDAESLIDGAEKAAVFFGAFPVGTVNVDVDVENEALRYRGRIPSFGK